MKLLLQRVTQAKVAVDQTITGKIEQGILVFVGFGQSDEALVETNALIDSIEKACAKIVNLRIFSNSDGKLDHSALDVSAEILLVPQFTLYGKSEKGRRPDFTEAMQPGLAKQAFEQFHQILSKQLGRPVETGVFGADMAVSLTNDGPFTLQLTF